MKKYSSNTVHYTFSVALLVFITFVFSAAIENNGVGKFPYKKAGLTEQQAAAHLISRFTYGATPNLVNEVAEMGVEKWFAEQLNANLPNEEMQQKLAEYDALLMNNEQIAKYFPRNPQVLRAAIADGFIDKDEVDKDDKAAYRQKLADYMNQKGLRPEKELFRQFINQKIIRATYSNNQLQEVMTDFWFNHFNVSISKPQCAQFIPVYERDVIRPNVFGNFNQLVLATAKSPAMLLYLDNFSSAGINEEFENKVNNYAKRLAKLQSDTSSKAKKQLQQLTKNRSQGLNENYAREVMELHTLGVDGGYTQTDVTQAAKILTGWTIYPFNDYGQVGTMKKIVERIGDEKMAENGFVHQGDFLFAINRHDASEKTVLGKKFPAGRGYEEGEELLNMLSSHTSTAKFISKKIATRFVNDNPPQSLIDKMAKTFLAKNGDIKQVLLTLVSSPEFWTNEALREKTKSPFELVISTVRILDADVTQPFQLNNWITKMGQQMYFYQAPTGFPDKAQYWINTGALLNRMNFGLALAAQKIPGVKFDLAELNNHKEPESAEKALEVYSKLMMPERDLTKTIQRLTPLLSDPNLINKVNEAANKTKPSNSSNDMQGETAMMGGENEKMVKERLNRKGQVKNTYAMNTSFSNSSMLSQVVGVIIGSPEFQRR